MNRMQQPRRESQPPHRAENVIEWGRYCSTPTHALFAPLHYEPGYAYPLVVWLHGPRDNEQQLKRIMPGVSMRNFVAVAPRGTQAECGAEPCGYRWQQTAEQISLAEQRTLAAIDAARENFNVEPRRVFVAGFGCGGTMAFRIALHHPQQFAGALSLGGAFPAGNRPLRNLAAVRRLPLFLACGTDSAGYPSAEVCDDLRLFHSAGLSVTLRQYPCGDELTTLMLADMNRWIMEQFCPASIPANSESLR